MGAYALTSSNRSGTLLLLNPGLLRISSSLSCFLPPSALPPLLHLLHLLSCCFRASKFGKNTRKGEASDCCGGLSGVVAMGGLGWSSWIANLLWVGTDTLFQRLMSMHVPALPPLTPLPHLTCIITGCTSGIGLQTAKYPSPIAGITFFFFLFFF